MIQFLPAEMCASFPPPGYIFTSNDIEFLDKSRVIWYYRSIQGGVFQARKPEFLKHRTDFFSSEERIS